MTDELNTKEPSEGCTRRELLLSAGAGIAGVALFGLSGCASMPTVRGQLQEGVIAVSREAVEEAVGPLTIVADGLTNPVILIPGDESPTALSARCTHQGCSVRANARALRCPCHGSTFDFDGEVISGPARRPLKIFPVRWTTDNLFIEIR